MEIISEKPTVALWHGIYIVQISTVRSKKSFSKWLSGKTLPFIYEEDDYTGWAYYSDYAKYMRERMGVI